MIAFLSPLFLAGAAAVAIPIAIHLFYKRAEPLVDFAATRYLRRAPVEQSQRRRLRELVLLALRAAALLLLALAFARPYVSQSAAALAAPATMVLVDTSVSMSGPGQFERARARAGQAIADAPAGHSVGIVSFGAGSTVVAPLSLDRGRARAAIANLKPGAGATRYRAALARAAEEFGDRPGRLVVITDLQQTGWDGADQGGVPDRLTVEVEGIEGPSANIALTGLRVEGTAAVAIVHNYSPRTATAEVAFSIDDRRIGAAAVSMVSGGSTEARLPLEGQAPGRLAAAVDDRQGYAADNVRYAVLDAANAPLVLAVTASGNPVDSLYLDRAMGITEGPGGFRFRAMSGPAFSDLEAPALAEASVIVVLGTRGLEQQGRERLAGFVRSGGGVLITAGPDVDPAILKGALNGIVQTSWRDREAAPPGRPLRFAPDDSRHPVFRLFGDVGTLGNVSFSRAALIDVPATADVVARYSDGTPALVEERTAGGRVLIFASDINDRWNDFPLQPAFVPFIHEALRYLTSSRVAKAEYLVGDLPGLEGLTPGIVSVGRATPPHRASAAGTPVSGSPGGPDKVRQTTNGTTNGENTNAERVRRVAINVDPRESDPARMSADEFRAGVSRLNASAARETGTETRDQEDGQRLWQYALLMMVVSLAAEGMLGRRLG